MQRLSFPKRVEVFNFIKSVGKVVDDHWIYNEGWNDHRIANNYHLTQTCVAGIRKELGPLPSQTGHLVGPRIAKLESDLSEHHRAILELERKINSLEANAQAHGWRMKTHA